MKGKLHIIGCAGIPARYGGFETFAEHFAVSLAKSRKVCVSCSSRLYGPGERSSVYKNVSRDFIALSPHGISALPYDLLSLLRAIRRGKPGDDILILGIGAGIFLPPLRMLSRRRYYVHLDGLEWKRPKWSLPVRIFLKLSHFLSLRFAHYILVDNEALLPYIKDRFRNKIHFLAYGGDHTQVPVTPTSPENITYDLVIARAEPENQLHLILTAYACFPERNLLIISNAKATSYGKKLLRDFKDSKNIHFREAIYDPELLKSYRVHCRLYIHGHSAGGTNPSLVEAMYAGLPVLCFDNTFNRVTTSNSAMYFKDTASLKELLAVSSSRDFVSPGPALKNIALRNYTWEHVVKDFNRISGA